MNKKLIVANWKMAPASLAEAEQILDSVDDYLGSLNEKEFSLVFCPPFVFIEEVGKILRTSHFEHQAELGAQDIFWDDRGADTGEVSGPMLNGLGVRYVIIGHSERRWKLGESDEIVNKKLRAALRNEIIPIVCIGERERNEDFKDFIRGQVAKTFEGLNQDELKKCIIAYEPVWAISTNPGARPDTPEDSLKAIRCIWGTINELGGGETWISTLYGGSVTSANAREFLSQKEIDGVLVGGASVNKEEFIKILSIAVELK